MSSNLLTQRRGLFFSLAFIGGFHVMALEMCAFRSLLFNFGSSIYVTGVLLTLVMSALSLGYVIGGRVSEKQNIASLLYVLLAVAVYLNIFDVLLEQTIFDFTFEVRSTFSAEASINTAPPSLAVLLLYVPPMVGMAVISPYLIKLLSTSSDVGITAGNLMAVSTIGSIAGTLAGTFLLVPVLGVRATVGIISISLLVVGAIPLLYGERRTPVMWASIGVAICSAGVFLLPKTPVENLVAEVDSAYGKMTVFRETDDDGDEYLRAVTTRHYEDSMVYTKTPLKDQMGLAYLSVAQALGAKKYLVLGVAGGGAIVQLRAMDLEAEVTGVELVPAAVELARTTFGVETGEKTKLIVEDARVHLRSSRETFDYIIVDLFRGDHAPVQCATAEFFALVKQKLNPGGIMFVNSNLNEAELANGYDQDLPRNHFHSAIFHAGFSSMYQHDFFGQGMIYAFRDVMPPELLLGKLADAARAEKYPAELRASFALAYLHVLPVPEARRKFGPFTDDWVPETLLQERFKLPELMRRTAKWVESKRGAAREQNGDLEMILAKHLADHWAKEKSPGVDSEAYCAEVERWYEQQPGARRESLAKYFWVPYCWENAEGPLADYMQGLRLASENRGKEALAPLLSAIEDLSAGS